MNMIQRFGGSRAFLCEIEKTNNRKRRLRGGQTWRSRLVQRRQEGVAGSREDDDDSEETSAPHGLDLVCQRLTDPRARPCPRRQRRPGRGRSAWSPAGAHTQNLIMDRISMESCSFNSRETYIKPPTLTKWVNKKSLGVLSSTNYSFWTAQELMYWPFASQAIPPSSSATVIS